MPTPRETASAMFATAHEMLADAERVADSDEDRAEVIRDTALRLVDLAHTVLGWSVMRDIDFTDEAA